MTTKSVKRGNKVAKPTRTTSNAFAAFEQFQLQEFKEAFNLLDKDRDGLIGYSDLESAFSSLGKNCANEIIKEMLDESNGPLNFTMFLTLFADRMATTDNENMILNAFATFDDDQSGGFLYLYYDYTQFVLVRHYSCVKRFLTSQYDV
jgi:Ca2+-binding EF-hand superfamily protein